MPHVERVASTLRRGGSITPGGSTSAAPSGSGASARRFASRSASDKPPMSMAASAKRGSVSSVTRKNRPSRKSGDSSTFQSTANANARPSSHRLVVESAAGYVDRAERQGDRERPIGEEVDVVVGERPVVRDSYAHEHGHRRPDRRRSQRARGDQHERRRRENRRPDEPGPHRPQQERDRRQTKRDLEMRRARRGAEPREARPRGHRPSGHGVADSTALGTRTRGARVPWRRASSDRTPSARPSA